MNERGFEEAQEHRRFVVIPRVSYFIQSTIVGWCITASRAFFGASLGYDARAMAGNSGPDEKCATS